jgi:prepilin-type N-terminal cleavage/methylation domain-containing protein
MKKNKKGFTLTELLAVLVILAIISVIGTVGVQSILKSVKENLTTSKIKMIKEAAIVYGEDNQDKLTGSCTIHKLDDKGNFLSNQTETVSLCTQVKTSSLIPKYLKTDEKCDATGYKSDNGTIACITDNRDNSSLNDKMVYVYFKNNRVYAQVDFSLTN